MRKQFKKIIGTILLMAILFPSISFAALTDNLVSYWKMDGNSNDSVGVNNGTDTNITYSTLYGIINQGRISGTGASDGINAGNDASLNFTTTDFSFNLWVNNSSYNVNGGNTILICRGEYAVAGYFLQIINSGNNGTLHFFTSQAGTAQETISSNGALVAGGWHMVTVTRTGTTVKIYIDTTDVTATSGSHTNPLTNTSNFYIGRYNVTTLSFPGSMDEVSVYTRVLSSAEISSLYNGGSGLQWPFSTIVPYFGFFTLFGDW